MRGILNDRRGLAIEQVAGPRAYRPDTLEVLYETGPDYLVYVDGVQRGRCGSLVAAEVLGAHLMGGRR